MVIKEKIYKNILKALFFLSFISPLVVDRRLFFPYVAPMALYFRLIVELLFVLWIIYILLYPHNRPKMNILIRAIGLYLVALSAATLFSSNPYLSFWGDAERMMGFFGIFHYFILFFIGTSLFKDKKELRKMIIVYTGVSLLVCFYGILQRFGLTDIKPGATRILATIGNAGHLAAYLIFGLFFSLYLALSEKSRNLKIIFYATVLIHLISVIFTGTRGAYLGIIAGFLFFIVFLILFGFKEKANIKKKLLIGLSLFIVFYAFIFINKDKEFVKENLYLYRLTHFSTNDVTVKTRFMSWRWGLAGFKEKPILGYGFENFAIPFNKHFEAEYYNYAAGDTYFDRAHNIVIELLATTGVVGTASYFLLLTIIIWSLFKVNKNDNYAMGVFGGLLLAYFIQNLFIFDLLPAMIGFAVFLTVVNNSFSINSNDNHKKGLKTEFIIPIILILLIGFSYSVKRLIIDPYKSLKDSVFGQVFIDNDYEQGMKYLKSSVNRKTVLDLDLKSTVANTIFNYYVHSGIDRPEKKSDIGFAIKMYEENLKLMPEDLYYNYKIGDIINYRFAANLDIKFIPQARKYIDKATSLSPRRIEIYYLLASNLLMEGKLDKAVETAEYAVSLNDKYGEAWWELTKVYYLANKYDKARESLIKMVELGYKINEENLKRLQGLFDIEHKIEEQILFFELMVKNGTADYLIPSTLANYYLEKGDVEKAIEYARLSAEINPAVKEKVDGFIKSAEAKRK